MMGGNNEREKKDAIIAAAVTFGVALIVIVLLFCMSLKFDRQALSDASIPEFQDDEEYYLEPELLVIDNPGDENATEKADESAPQPPGEPELADEEQPILNVKNSEVPKEEPVSSKPKLVSTTKESDVKTSTPKVSAEEQKVASDMGSKFNSNNGSRDGQDSGTAGAGGNGNVNAQGKLSGRQMLSCPRQNVGAISFTKGTVTVNVTVTAAGTVSSASVASASPTSISNTVKNKCITMAKGSKWTPKEGAPNAQGTITFTITRKQ